MRRYPLITWLTVAALVLLLWGGQWVADGSVSLEGQASTGRLLGRTGFAYLTGLRTFAAAALWNRIDPQFHEYYGSSLEGSAFMLPTLRIVTWLDPQFIQAYWVGPWIVGTHLGMEEEAMAFALEGVANNPHSGLLLTQLAQFHLLSDDMDAALEWADRAVRPAVDWLDLLERHDSYAILRGVYRVAGDTEMAERLASELETLDAQIEEQYGEDVLDHAHEEHDHDDHDH